MENKIRIKICYKGQRRVSCILKKVKTSKRYNKYMNRIEGRKRQFFSDS